ncbi:MAG: hypothetical protein MJB14_15760 [Spirochaetes bacterium]|nr:hypothetical protein [Spirochaetota bacterium]
MATYILNKYQAPKFKLNPSQYNILIRVTNPQEEFKALENESIYRDVLELKFYDFVEEQGGLIIFNESHLSSLLNFFKKHKNCENFVVHCDQGMSRSAGIAVGWLAYNQDRASIYKIYHNRKHIPNRLIVEHFYKKLGLTMKYINKWEREKFANIKDD